MRFYEYEAKAVLAKNGIPTSKGGLAKSGDDAARLASEIAGDVVLKSQVLSGGRMKAGGVKFASSPDEARAHAEAIVNLEIGGQLPRGVPALVAVARPATVADDHRYAGRGGLIFVGAAVPRFERFGEGLRS